jgi:hypothetical protein
MSSASLQSGVGLAIRYGLSAISYFWWLHDAIRFNCYLDQSADTKEV